MARAARPQRDGAAESRAAADLRPFPRRVRAGSTDRVTNSRHRAGPAIRTPHSDAAERPFIVIWECTQACPLACAHCRAEAREWRDPAELSTAEAGALAAQVAAFGRPAPLFVITGGDPFARPDLFDIVREAAGHGLHVAVSPSGTPTLTEDNLQALHDAGATAISLSLDGSTAAIHDGFRRVDGVYDWTLRAWDTARRIGLRVQINTTVTGHNLDDLPEIVRVVADHGAMTWSAFVLVPTGRGRELDELDAATVENVLNFVYDAGAYVPARTTEAHHFRRVALQRQVLAERGIDHVGTLGLGPRYTTLRSRLDEVMAGVAIRTHRAPMDVNAGRGFVFISHRGEVHPSGFLPLAAGNVREQPLTEIYRESGLFRRLRDPAALHGRCGRCEFVTVCGGSRSRAFAMTGDPLETEPWCAYEPGSFPFPEDIRRLLPA